MARFKVYGASDDLVEFEGDFSEEFPTNGHWEGVLTAPDGGTAILYVDYRGTGTWTVTLGQWEEDYILPAWAVDLSTDLGTIGYSTVLTLEVPAGTVLRENSKGAEEFRIG